jgi:hypothetical protein
MAAGRFWVGVAGFEPTASSSRTKRATKLRHTPHEATTAYRTGPATRQSGLSPRTAGYPMLIVVNVSLLRRSHRTRRAIYATLGRGISGVSVALNKLMNAIGF